MPKPSIKFCLSALCFAAVTYNGLILPTALYSVILALIQVGDSGRLPVEKTFFAPDPDLGWTILPRMTFTLSDTNEKPLSRPYFSTND